MTDQELLISTLRKAHQILGEYLEPGTRDADETITQLIAVLDTQDLARRLNIPLQKTARKRYQNGRPSTV
jgi:hypothetical protein